MLVEDDVTGWELSLDSAKEKEEDISTLEQKLPIYHEAVLDVCYWVYGTRMLWGIDNWSNMTRSEEYEETFEFSELDFMNLDDDDYSDQGNGVAYSWCKNWYDVADDATEDGLDGVPETDGTENGVLLSYLRQDLFELWGKKIYVDGESTDVTGDTETYLDIFTGYLKAKEYNSMATESPFNISWIDGGDLQDLFDMVYWDDSSLTFKATT